MKRVLVVEDEPEIRRLVELHLRDIGCHVGLAATGREGLKRAQQEVWDLIILDLMLPQVDGLEICRQVRAAPSGRPYTPILMLTAKSTEIDRVLGLETGADDYLVKPFSVRELMARVRAIFRRVEAIGLPGRSAGEAEEIVVGGLEIDSGRRRVVLDGKQLHLTAKEFDLLLYFARHPGHVYTRNDLLEKVWGYGHGGYEHTVNSHINRLRSKIERDPAQPCLVLTVWGVGYRFAEVHELEPDPTPGKPGKLGKLERSAR